ncbi:unnamed protein product [Ixodes pacificus]
MPTRGLMEQSWYDLAVPQIFPSIGQACKILYPYLLERKPFENIRTNETEASSVLVEGRRHSSCGLYGHSSGNRVDADTCGAKRKECANSRSVGADSLTSTKNGTMLQSDERFV